MTLKQALTAHLLCEWHRAAACWYRLTLLRRWWYLSLTCMHKDCFTLQDRMHWCSSSAVTRGKCPGKLHSRGPWAVSCPQAIPANMGPVCLQQHEKPLSLYLALPAFMPDFESTPHLQPNHSSVMQGEGGGSTAAAGDPTGGQGRLPVGRAAHRERLPVPARGERAPDPGHCPPAGGCASMQGWARNVVVSVGMHHWRAVCWPLVPQGLS